MDTSPKVCRASKRKLRILCPCDSCRKQRIDCTHESVVQITTSPVFGAPFEAPGAILARADTTTGSKNRMYRARSHAVVLRSAEDTETKELLKRQQPPVRYRVTPQIDRGSIPAHNIVCHLPVPTVFQFRYNGVNESFSIQKPLGIGKYGQVLLVSRASNQRRPPTPHACTFMSNLFVVKRLTHRVSYNLEVKAYTQMTRQSSHVLDTDAAAAAGIQSGHPKTSKNMVKSSSFGGISKGAVARTVRSSPGHPFVIRLLAMGAVREKAANIPSSKRDELQCQQMNRGKVRGLKAFTSLFHNNHSVKVFMLLQEYGEGGDLQDLASRYLNQPMEPHQAAFYVAEIAEALIWLHDVGVVHQDLKLDNVLVRADGHIALADFGLAAIPPRGPRTSYISTIVSSSRHMPPEISQSHRMPKNSLVWHAVDWYSLGVLFYRLMFRENPPVKGPFALSNLPDVSRCLLEGLLASDPRHRLGGGQLGGRTVLCHPGLLKLLIPSAGANLPAHLVRAAKRLIASPSIYQAGDDYIGFSESQTLYPGEFNLPIWAEQLRQAVRVRCLLPPFVPSLDTVTFPFYSSSSSSPSSYFSPS